MFTTNKRLLCCKEALNHGSECKILWDTFQSQIAELWFPYDRNWSQTIAEDRTWFYLLRSSAIVCDHDRRIADDHRSVFPYDRRRSQNFLRSAIRDPRSSAIIWKPAYRLVKCARLYSDWSPRKSILKLTNWIFADLRHMRARKRRSIWNIKKSLTYFFALITKEHSGQIS